LAVDRCSTLLRMTQAELAYEHFTHRLAVETDADDVGSALQDGTADFLLIDARSPAAYAAAHLPGAFSYPHRGLTREALDALPDGPILREGYPVEGEQAARHHKDQTGLVALPSETTVGCTLPTERSGPAPTPT
jgi:rhodanese-related sulfurtransferase